MKRKGITPVIAVVLLLLITVGAVASAWGLYQQITSDQSQVDQLNQRQAAANTDISAQSVYRSDSSGDGHIMVDLRNQGSEPVNLSINGSDVDYLVSPPSRSSYFEFSMFDRVGISTDFPATADNCFWNEGKVLGTDSTVTCNTTIPFPGAGQTYDFELNYQNVDGYSWSFECSPGSSDAIRCD